MRIAQLINDFIGIFPTHIPPRTKYLRFLLPPSISTANIACKRRRIIIPMGYGCIIKDNFDDKIISSGRKISGGAVSLFVSGSNIHPGSHPSGAVIQNVGGAIGNATFSTCITSFSKINASIKNTPSHSINHQSHYRRHSPHP